MENMASPLGPYRQARVEKFIKSINYYFRKNSSDEALGDVIDIQTTSEDELSALLALYYFHADTIHPDRNVGIMHDFLNGEMPSKLSDVHKVGFSSVKGAVSEAIGRSLAEVYDQKGEFTEPLTSRKVTTRDEQTETINQPISLEDQIRSMFEASLLSKHETATLLAHFGYISLDLDSGVVDRLYRLTANRLLLPKRVAHGTPKKKHASEARLYISRALSSRLSIEALTKLPGIQRSPQLIETLLARGLRELIDPEYT